MSLPIVYIQPIFAPNQKQLERNIDSIKSAGEYMQFYKGISQVILGGYAKPEFWDYIKNAVHDAFGNLDLKVIEYDRNYGKPTVINTLSKFINSNIQYIITADSDIKFTLDHPNIFIRLIEAFKVIEEYRGQKVGLIALNQIEANFHLDCVYENEFIYNNSFKQEEKIVWPNGVGGIAGGCLCINKQAWLDVGGYRVYGVYAGDDAYLLIDLHNNGYTIQMIETIGVIHPHDDDIEYSTWKVHVCQRDSGQPLNDFESKVIEAEQFWKSRD